MSRNNVPVDVIFLSDSTGKIRPLRIRAEAEAKKVENLPRSF